MKRRGFLIFCFRILPKGILSRLFGKFSRKMLPKSILNKIINWWCRKYQVNCDEIVYPEDGFQTLDEFFVRRVKKGVHQVDKRSNSVVSPVDGRIDQFGDITGTRVLQAKGIDYLLSEMIPADIHHAFIDGSFMTIYLSPADYHRIHSPVEGKVSGFLHMPGKLFPVQEYMVNGISGLFSKNERIISYIQSDYGKCAVCKIGAMNVGRISLSYAGKISNMKSFRKKKEILYQPGMEPTLKRGTELGKFHLGSTIVLLFGKEMVEFESVKIGQKVRMGQRIAKMVPQKN